MALTNLGGDSTFNFAVGTSSGGVAFSVSPASVTIASGGSGKVTITMTAAKGAVPGDHQAIFTVSVGGYEVAHAAVYTFIK